MFNLTAFLSYAVVVIFTPGPNNIISLALANKIGFKKAVNYPIGVMIGFFILLLLSSFFNLLLANLIPAIRNYMGILGALYMLLLAYKILVSQNGSDKNEEVKSQGLILYGISMQFMNPKAILFAVTIVAGFITPYFSSAVHYLGFSILLALLAFVSTIAWATFGSVFKKFLTKFQRQFNLVMVMLLVYSALNIAGLI
ncbi:MULTISPECIES: LysE family transporter [unclassified Fusibacter]|uniref:LysE family transporter n=1 Tax=unclassified Fusibacter TaxID=2624464 RepID=UPI001011EF29|nr:MULTISPECIES: LysE family transporter [unclassified Fusibacter]MCK8060747.1 LysE family transporter [Fusibacter sp. A2]NPE23043.1 LysE family transporter [Fusibacter sp. A1]RXV59715.1 lysine transporter LysE [Fusibacter sp. A1]